MSLSKKLADYKIGEVLLDFKKCPPRSVEEWYGYVIGHILTGNLQKSREILQENKKTLKEQGIYELLHFKVEYEQSSDVSTLLYDVLAKPKTQFPKYVSADFDFIIGFYFLREKNFPAARAFYQKSLRIYQELNFISAVWRAKFNLHLTESFSTNKKNELLKDFDNLMEERNSLNVEAQVYTARFLGWYLLFLGEFERARDFIEASLHQARDLQDELGLEQMEKYSIYINFCFNKKDPTGNASPALITSSSSLFAEATVSLDLLSARSVTKMLREIDQWKNKFNIAERYMLLDMLFDLLSSKGMHEKVLELFSRLESRAQVFQSILFYPRNLYWHVIIAFETLDKSAQMPLEYFYKFSQTASKFHMISLKDTLNQIKKSRRKALIDPLNYQIEVFGKTYSFPINSKAFSLILLLKKAGHSSSPNFLIQSIYNETPSFEGVSKLNALIKRLNKKLGKNNLIRFNDGTISLSKEYTWVLKNEKVESQKNRYDKIRALASQSRKGISTNQLSKVILASHRTILTDLKNLTDRGEILKLGKGKKTLYRSPTK